MDQIGHNLDLARPPASAQPPAVASAQGLKYPLHPKPGRKSWLWMLDPAWFSEAFARRWHWAFILVMALALAGGLWGGLHLRQAASLYFVRDNPAPQLAREATGPLLQTTPLPPLPHLLQSAELLQRVSARSTVPRTPQELQANLELVPGRDDAWEVRISAPSRAQAAQIAEVYAAEAARYLRELQGREAARLDNFLDDKLKALDESLEQANAALTLCLREAGFVDLEKGLSLSLQQHQELSLKLDNVRIQKETLDLQITNLYKVIASHHPALLAAKQALDQALLRYTEEHPKVQELRTNMLAIEARVALQSAQGDPEIALNASSLAQSLYAKVIELRNERLGFEKQSEQVSNLIAAQEEKLAGLSARQITYLKAKSHYESLRNNRAVLAGWKNQNQLLQQASPGGYRIGPSTAPAKQPGLRQWSLGALWAAGAGLLGLMFSALLIAFVEVFDGRIRSPRELARISNLPLLASLPDLQHMERPEQKAWAFQTLTTLLGALTAEAGQSLVCGFISSQPKEGRSTWVQLLSEAAGERGFRVVTLVCNRPSGASAPAPESNLPPTITPVLLPHDITRTALSAELPPIVEIPFTAWAWNLDHRAQWQAALNQLKSMENLIVLIEFPAASFAESVLLSENLSPLIWLCRKDAAHAAETARQLETLRNSRAPVVGTVFNDCAPKPRHGFFGRFFGAARLASLLLFLAFTATAAQQPIPAHVGPAVPATPATPPAPAAPIPPTTPATPAMPEATVPSVVLPLPPNSTPATLSASSELNLGDWQKRLTLGSGDVLQISIYGQTESVRPNLAIGPDGRINYLQARDVVASGLTVDELRDELEKTLLKFYRPPLRVVIVPQAYRSKKFYLLGNVTTGGVYPLDRPVTIVEALANAGGFVSVVQKRTSLTLVDFSRSFLIRKEAPGQFKRLPVNFEGLFLRGELQENVALAPEDYLYFSPQDIPEVYVLGEVTTPGVAPFSPGMSAMKAVASAGGFTIRAWRQKLLVVRGSLSRPSTFMVNASDVLAAKAPDFKLEPRDIVFVYRKPWARAEELLEIAITDFMRAAIVTYSGLHVDPLITSPIIH